MKMAQAKTIKPKADLRKYSLTEYVRNAEVPATFEAGFRVWMKLDKKEPLKGRTKSEWDSLMKQYGSGGNK
jgi:hypothetical protein